jgi:hypothetical protein
VPETGPYNYDNTPSLVGDIYNFVSPLPPNSEDAGCANCKKQKAEGHLVTGQIFLSNPLITRWKQAIRHPTGDGENEILRSMRVEDVAPFLKVNLHWRVVTVRLLLPSVSPLTVYFPAHLFSTKSMTPKTD